ncbi:hypothetical protein GOP47_0025173 [Adiantum capillus-veneris]|uniref:Uncharacterized protein n=1 Tax=Adiantum capillus-veneris TaxID=13818 RepID=A0A9D4U4B3_ADICA|nr:hypothetical protein GOP47_0025173 [Adiantum capillus-veneris]
MDGSCSGQLASRSDHDAARRSSILDDNADAGAYEKLLRRARWAGRTAAFLYTFSSILAFCNLTWATVVLLGAYVGSLLRADYVSIVFLLVLEATRLASAAFVTQLLTRAPNPGHFHAQHNSSRLLWSKRLHIRLLSSLLQVLLIIPPFVCSAKRLSKLHLYNHPASSENLNLHTSLLIFYSLVMVNAFFAATMALLALAAWLYFQQHKEKSLRSYFDEVLRKAIEEGVMEADNFIFFDFAIRLLGRVYAGHNYKWQTVLKDYKALIHYFYEDKEGKDYVLTYLTSGDAAVQQAAANLVGAWAAEMGTKLQLPMELLTRLADMVGTGNIGWAAVNSLGLVAAKSNSVYVTRPLSSNGKPALHCIVELVYRHNGRRSLASVRALIFIYDKLWQEADNTSKSSTEDTNTIFNSSWRSTLPRNLQTQLAEELTYLLQQEDNIQRLRVHAAYLLYLLEYLHTNRLHPARFRDHVKSIIPTKDTNIEPWFDNEQIMLEHLLGKMSLPLPVDGYPPDMRRSPYVVSPPPRAINEPSPTNCSN